MTLNCARCHDHKFDPLRQLSIFKWRRPVGGLVRKECELPVPAPAAIGSPRARIARGREEIGRRFLASLLGAEGQALIRQARAEAATAAEQAVEAARTALAEAEKKSAAASADGKPTSHCRRPDARSAQRRRYFEIRS